MFLLEILFEILAWFLVEILGMRVHWAFLRVVGQTKMPFAEYQKRMQRQRDPSNAFSYGCLHFLLGCGALFILIFGVAAIVESIYDW
ncbi:MAG TPA: hypothetical protein VD927_16550 [Chryseosolibacter sp.]|nr:hypothetical protein [Chryseosolibacter sp.]